MSASDLTPQTSGTSALAVYPPQRSSLLTAPREQFDRIINIADLLSASSLSKSSKNDIAIIMLKGFEVGLQPLQSIDMINVIQGKPTISPAGMLALINQSGYMTDMQIAQDSDSVTVTMTRSGRSPHTERFTMDDAKAMGLAGRDNWRKQPGTMLKWRAISACARVVFPDVIQGMYTPEEISPEIAVNDQGDVIDAVPEVASTKPAPQVTVEDVPTTKPAPQPDNVVEFAQATGAHIVAVQTTKHGIGDYTYLVKCEVAPGDVVFVELDTRDRFKTVGWGAVVKPWAKEATLGQALDVPRIPVTIEPAGDPTPDTPTYMVRRGKTWAIKVIAANPDRETDASEPHIAVQDDKAERRLGKATDADGAVAERVESPFRGKSPFATPEQRAATQVARTEPPEGFTGELNLNELEQNRVYMLWLAGQWREVKITTAGSGFVIARGGAKGSGQRYRITDPSVWVKDYEADDVEFLCFNSIKRKANGGYRATTDDLILDESDLPLSVDLSDRDIENLKDARYPIGSNPAEWQGDFYATVAKDHSGKTVIHMISPYDPARVPTSKAVS